jgi:hypothetical protein
MRALVDGADGAPSLYTRLARRIGSLRFTVDGHTLPVVSPGRVFLTEYYDPTHDPHGFSFICPQEMSAPAAAVRRWGHDVVLRPVNDAIGLAAQRNGWRLVGGIADAFRAHGLCAPWGHFWVNGVVTSLNMQGDVSGAWHPNVAGQRAIADKLLDAMRPVLGAG